MWWPTSTTWWGCAPIIVASRFTYRLELTPTQARALLLDYVDSIDRLVERPQFYKVVDNCTTSIRRHVNTSNRAPLLSIGVFWPTGT